jgi:integrase
MPRLTRRLPSYRLHKPSGRAVVTLNGRDHYLGDFDTPESRAEYERVIAEFLANRQFSRAASVATDAGSSDLTINEVIVAFWRHAERHYRTPSGKQSSELANFRDTFRPLKKLYGETIAREFSPLKLKALRGSMIEAKLCRNTINQRIGRIVHVFKWAASEELVPASVHQALKTVSGLQKGRTDATESEPVRPVPDAFVDAIKPFVSRQVWAMIELQRLTGMRPGEVCVMRTCDLDRSGNVWVYTPPDHKMLYRGRGRSIVIGPQAQTVLKPWLKADPTAFLFSPAEARAERFATMRAKRKSKVQPSQRDRSKPGGKRRPAERYTTHSYYNAVVSGCKQATRANQEKGVQDPEVPPWHPNQLRHNAATRIRREFGLDAARAILGHTSPVVTEVYAEMDHAKAVSVMEKVG